MADVKDKKHIRNVKFGDLTQIQDVTPANEIRYFVDVPLTLTVELGRTKKTLRDLLELEEGSIIELNKQAGESVDLIINKNIVAKGEVVVIDENFGVRITEIVSSTDIDKKMII